MRLASLGGTLLTALALAASSPVVAGAQLVLEPVTGFHGVLEAVPIGGAEKDPRRQATAVVTDVYRNTSSTANFGFSSTDPAAKFGDQVLTTGTGLLSTHEFTVFNSSNSLGTLLTAQIQLEFFDTDTLTSLGSYIVPVNFGGGLTPGFYTLISVPNLEPLMIVLDATDIIVRQRLLSKTGDANRLGVASLNPPTVGSSPDTMFMHASTANGGVPGFYNVAAGPANPGYLLAVSPPPTSVTSRSWGALKRLYR